jgi:succinate-semialdehyde dehydrogenase/glutarate-semialdehyde dehydrogenase
MACSKKRLAAAASRLAVSRKRLSGLSCRLPYTDTSRPVDLDGCLIHPPAGTDGVPVLSEGFFQQWQKPDRPAVDRGMVHHHAAPVGKQLAALAGKHMKRVTMELGGHAPVIVAEDADVELAVRASGGAKFRNAGQVCISPTRFLVHQSIRNEFAAALVKHAQGLKVGHGSAEDTQMGPLANSRRLTAMAEFTKDAVDRGAAVIAGGEQITDVGNFFAPTVLMDVPLDARVFNEEPFGPVTAIRTFNHLDEAISEANRLPYGLAGYAFTRSLSSAHLLAQRLELGMLWINQPAAPWPEMPFGGLKDSGYGSEGGPEALDAYLNAPSVSIMNV